VSRAFVKEDQADLGREVVPERAAGSHPNYITPRGLRALQAKAEELRQERQRVLAGSSRGMGDQEAAARIDRELRAVLARVDGAIPVDQSHLCEHEVHFGSEVTVADPAGEERTYVIVGEDEADLGRGLISWTSPLARAMTGARKGEFVILRRPSGEVELEIVRVRNAVLD
jgi:transcription elongation GreA/GreB family factor